MPLVRTARQLADALSGARCTVVPTMGALHPGHLRLIDTAKSEGLPVVVTVFVNPAQFNKLDDFTTYPRDLDRDVELSTAAGAAAVFAPGVDEVYPDGPYVLPSDLPPVAVDKGLEDEGRPGHFLGVVRVLRRLFHMTGCQAAVFGEKDYQQLLVARAIAGPVRILPHPIERDPDGLAMSSRNVRLSPEARTRALAIPKAIAEARRVTTIAEAEDTMRTVIVQAGGDLGYATIRNAKTLKPLPPDLQLGDPKRPDARVLVTADFDGVRLLDNAPWTTLESP